MKRFFCLFLTLAMLVGMVPVPAGATQTNAQVTNDDVTIEGTNGFGQLLSEDIQQQYQRETEYSGAYSVTDLTIAGNTAVVEYGAMEEAILVVAIYSEDGLQMITSGKTTVSPDNTEATVTISNMPQYFMASAFLVDTYDYSPLCESYETPMYTREMQELLASTIHDYDADRVLNLDEDETTNFAVYAEDTILVEEQMGVNTVISADDETMTYVIGNADDTFLWLQPGDVVAYPYGEENFLFCKVAEIAVEGTTVTIQGEETQMEDYFSYIKLESDGITDGIEVDENSGDEGVTYLGLEQEESPATFGLRDIDFGGNAKASAIFDLKMLGTGGVTGGGPTDGAYVGMSGTAGLTIEGGFKYYKTVERSYFDLKIDLNIKLAMKVGGKINRTIKLKDITLPTGISKLLAKFKFTPVILVKIDAAIEFSAKFGGSIGFAVDSDTGFQNRCGGYFLKTDSAIKGSVFIGWDMKPRVEVLHEKVCTAVLSVPWGITIEGELIGKEDVIQAPEGARHGCNKCLNMDFSFTAGGSSKLKFAKWSYTYNIYNFKLTLGHAYYSYDHAEFGWGSCPYLEYLVTISTCDTDGKPVPQALVLVDDTELGTTNSYGVLEVYAPAGKYTLKATRQEGDTVTQKIKVKDACSTRLLFKTISQENPDDGGDGETTEPEETLPGVFGTVSSTTIARPVGAPITGPCGPSASFAFYEATGLLTISGTGAITRDDLYYEIKDSETGSVTSKYYGSWPYGIREIRIGEGITSIGYMMFAIPEEGNPLMSVSIPASVHTIGDFAFSGCVNLGNVKIAKAINNWGSYVFNGCTGLRSFYLPDGSTTVPEGMFDGCFNLKTVRIPDTVKKIEQNAFYMCSSLKTVKLPASVTEIGMYAFYETGLETLTIPEGVTRISDQAFGGCQNLVSVEIPASVTALEWGAFENCRNLETVELAEGIPEIGNGVFAGCGIRQIWIPESVTKMDAFVFRDCKELTDVHLPGKLEGISVGMFEGCTKLETIQIPDAVSSIYSKAFINCRALKKIELPQGVKEIGNDSFTNCTSLTEINIPSDVNYIGKLAFFGTSLTSIEIPGSALIRESAFPATLKEVWFTGDVPSCETAAFASGDCVGFYPAENETWTYDNLLTQPGLSFSQWHPYTIDENGKRVVDWEQTIPGKDPASEEFVPETTAPGESVPDTTTAETIVQENNMAMQIVPETTTESTTETTEATVVETIPETTASVEIVAETIPETTAATIPETTAETETLTDPAGEQSLLDALLSPFVVEASAEEAVYDGEVHEPAVNGVFGGEYGAEETETYTLRTATFHDLVPGKQYVLLDMVSISGSDPLTASNLLTMDQGTADSSGTLVFEYVQRQDYEASYIVACGPSNQDLKEAFITFPDMEATDELQAINPTVDYYGDILKEGQDYVLLGQVSFTEAGEYVCFVRGIHQYTGLVKCTYTVGGPMRGDLNADGTVNIQDAIYLIWYTLFPTQYPLSVSGDMNRDNAVNDTDAVYLLWYILFPEVYPL